MLQCALLPLLPLINNFYRFHFHSTFQLSFDAFDCPYLPKLTTFDQQTLISYWGIWFCVYAGIKLKKFMCKILQIYSLKSNHLNIVKVEKEFLRLLQTAAMFLGHLHTEHFSSGSTLNPKEMVSAVRYNNLKCNNLWLIQKKKLTAIKTLNKHFP